MLNIAEHEDALQSESSKAEIILVAESRVRDIVSLLEEFEKVKEYVNPPSGLLEELPQMSVKLKPLEAVHLSQLVCRESCLRVSERRDFLTCFLPNQELAEKQQGQTVKLLETYNNITHTLSKAFVAWDAALAQLEKGQK